MTPREREVAALIACGYANRQIATALVISPHTAEHHVEHILARLGLASRGVDHGGLWPSKLVSAKYHAVEAAKQIVDRAFDVTGGAGLFKRHELERLYRDVRSGTVHPANRLLVHEIVGKSALGVLGEYPRWG